MAQSIRGPGTIIRQTLAAWGITEHSGCGCTDIANEMDKDGPDNTEIKLEYYVQKMNNSIVNWKASGNVVQQNIPTPEFAVRKLISYGVNKSREEAVAV